MMFNLFAIISLTTDVLCSPTTPSPGLRSTNFEAQEGPGAPMKRPRSVSLESEDFKRTRLKLFLDIPSAYHLYSLSKSSSVDIPNYNGTCEIQVYHNEHVVGEDEDKEHAALLCRKEGAEDICFSGETFTSEDEKGFLATFEEDVLVCPRFSDYYLLIEEWLRQGLEVDEICHWQDEIEPYRNVKAFKDGGMERIFLPSTLFHALIFDEPSPSAKKFGYKFIKYDDEMKEVMEKQMADLRGYLVKDFFQVIFVTSGSRTVEEAIGRKKDCIAVVGDGWNYLTVQQVVQMLNANVLRDDSEARSFELLIWIFRKFEDFHWHGDRFNRVIELHHLIKHI
jgi:hypothetical protein